MGKSKLSFPQLQFVVEFNGTSFFGEIGVEANIYESTIK
jgi:hypothetical protein